MAQTIDFYIDATNGQLVAAGSGTNGVLPTFTRNDVYTFPVTIVCGSRPVVRTVTASPFGHLLRLAMTFTQLKGLIHPCSVTTVIRGTIQIQPIHVQVAT